jgi:RNA polymerase sigma-70 factor (ECF subfamily)
VIARPSAQYDAHVDRVFRIAYRLAGDSDLARGFTQEAFARANSRLSPYRGDASLPTWLHTIATSVSLYRLGQIADARSLAYLLEQLRANR